MFKCYIVIWTRKCVSYFDSITGHDDKGEIKVV